MGDGERQEVVWGEVVALTHCTSGLMIPASSFGVVTENENVSVDVPLPRQEILFFYL